MSEPQPGEPPGLSSVVDDLLGVALRSVRYFVFPEWWDNGDVHERVMAVELESDSGAVYTVTWGQEPEMFSIDVRPVALASFASSGRRTPFGDVNSGGDLSAVEMSNHGRWRSLLPSTIGSASVGWGVSAASDSAPIALRLALGGEAVWVATGERQDETWFWGMDELTVVFGDPAAAEVGLTSAVGWRA